jgi:hypothetical protein
MLTLSGAFELEVMADMARPSSLLKVYLLLPANIAADEKYPLVVIAADEGLYFFRYQEEVGSVGVDPVFRYPVEESVEGAGEQAFDDPGVRIRSTGHGHYVISLPETGDHLRDVSRRMLKVAIHADHRVARCMVYAGQHGRLMSEVTCEFQRLQLDPVCQLQGGDDFSGTIGASVIHENHFERNTRLFA